MSSHLLPERYEDELPITASHAAGLLRGVEAKGRAKAEAHSFIAYLPK